MRKCLYAVAAAGLSLALGLPAAAQLNPMTQGGLDLTAEDWQLLEAAAEKLYATDGKPVGATENWANLQSGNSGKIELIGNGEYEGMPCRKLEHAIVVKDVADPFRFTVDRCKTPDGDWKAR